MELWQVHLLNLLVIVGTLCPFIRWLDSVDAPDEGDD